MNISTKEIIRLTEHAAQIHYQWADKDSQRQATEAARVIYYAAMAAHEYEHLPDDEHGIVDWWQDLRRQVSVVWIGIMRGEG